MAFFKFRSAGQQGNETRSAPAAAAPAESVESMRRRARHRLLGAAVLVLVGVVGFPLLFDTQPRPVSSDIPIDIPDRSKTKPLAVPATPAAPSAKPEAAAKPESSSANVITERADGTEVTAQAPAAPAPKAEPKPEPKVEARPEPKPEHKPEPKTAEAKPAPKPAAAADDGARARALLDGAAGQSAAVEGRFVVQVGAFADAAKAREVRQKLEKAGLKTYTNVAKTSDGERTRVRVGPFASRADADKAAGKVKELALPAAVLTL